MAVLGNFKGTSYPSFQIGKLSNGAPTVQTGTVSPLVGPTPGNNGDLYIQYGDTANALYQMILGAWTLYSDQPQIGVAFATLDYSATSPQFIITLPSNSIILCTEISVLTAFDDSPTLNIGTDSQNNLLFDNSDIDLTTPNTDKNDTSFVLPGPGSSDIKAYFDFSDCTEGSLQIFIEYSSTTFSVLPTEATVVDDIAARNALTPVAGQFAYVLDSDGMGNPALYIWNGASWDGIVSGGGVTFPLTAPDGSASAPAYSFSNNGNLGMYRSGSNALSLAAAGSQIVLVSSDGVGINQSTIDASAILDIASTSKGILTPRMTTTQRTAISSPADGLLVYDTTAEAFYYYNAGSTSWETMGGGGGGSPGGSTGQVQYNNSGSFGGFTVSGDATLNTGTGALTLSTVNSDTGTFSSLTVNGKGLVTAATNLSLTSDVTGTASGSSLTTTVSAIQGTTVSGTTGTVDVVFSSNPTLTGTLTAADIAASGTISGSNLSGTNTGDQTITLTGDVTGSGTGSFAATIGSNKVTYSKIQQASADTLIGNPTVSTADVEEITLGSTLAFVGTELQTIAFSGGDVSSSANSFDLTVNSYNGGTFFGTMAAQDANDVAITGGSITGMSTPTGGSDVATKTYVDAATTGLDARASCRLATTGNLTAVYNNGSSGVGATLTYVATGTDTIDGQNLNLNDRILVKDQTTQYQNGIYAVTTVGVGATAGVLTRATDYDNSSGIVEGSYTVIEEGTANAGTLWIETGTGPFTIGTTSVTFTQLSVAPQTVTFTGDVTGTGAGTIALTLDTVNSNVGTFTAVTVNGKGLTTAATNLSLTGDITGTASGSSLATTLATVNTNTGSFGSSTAIPNFTVNGKGLVTAAGTNAVVAPAGTLTGTTLASNVVTSSLTTVGTLTNLTVTNPISGSITGNAATVTTNADLTGDVTSVGNATTIASAAVTASKLASGAAASNVGSLSGDLSGSLPNPTVAKINGTTVSGTTGTGDVVFSNSPTINGSTITNAIITKINIETITSSGAYTPTTGMVYCTVEIVGGGGGGGGGAAGSGSSASAGGGGAAGGYSKKTFAASTIGASQTVTIGGNGTGGSAGANNGTSGGNTTFGSLLTATGGGGGVGSSASSASFTFGGGSNASGGASGGDINIGGEIGATGLIWGSVGLSYAGAGGNPPALGFGGSATGPGNNGNPGTGHGAGGSGAGSNTGTAFAGGNGSGGFCTITEYISA